MVDADAAVGGARVARDRRIRSRCPGVAVPAGLGTARCRGRAAGRFGETVPNRASPGRIQLHTELLGAGERAADAARPSLFRPLCRHALPG